jgi:hypothetical protein
LHLKSRPSFFRRTDKGDEAALPTDREDGLSAFFGREWKTSYVAARAVWYQRGKAHA